MTEIALAFEHLISSGNISIWIGVEGLAFNFIGTALLAIEALGATQTVDVIVDQKDRKFAGTKIFIDATMNNIFVNRIVDSGQRLSLGKGT